MIYIIKKIEYGYLDEDLIEEILENKYDNENVKYYNNLIRKYTDLYDKNI